MYLKEGRPGRSHYMRCKQKANIWGVVPDEESRGSLPVQELVASVVNVHNILPTSNYCCLLHLGLIYSKETVWPALWCRKQLQSCEAMWQWVHKIRTQQVESLRACFLIKKLNKVLWAHFWGPFWSRMPFHQSYLYISALTHAKMKGHGARPVVVTMMASLTPSIIMVMLSSMCLHLVNFPRPVSLCHDPGS